ncbi:uncharacterized protein LOC142534613 [Primulina tabacum]|uniref:uncharacterized protein LOC142534613 n=1 Tax=Primulina tabacum TaxID=48773 RepID=UPI003F591E8B
MKPISPRPILNLSLLLIPKSTAANFWISQKFLFSSLTPQNPVFSYPQRRHDEESRNVRISVWWDFENCNLPCNTNVFKVAQCITNAVRANGIKGSLQITAFGDVMQISRTNQEALSSTGINLTHVPSGGKNSADRSLLVDLMYWVSQNPPPAHLFLISGDRDFAGILHRLRMSNYNILLASPDSAPSVLCGAATIMWQWSDLLRGENLTGKHFNQPPDGPYGSWYGHYKAPLEDPFAVTEQNTCLKSVELPESSPEKVRPIPKAVTKYIRHVLTSYPEGIHISQLRNELVKSNLIIDKGLYGYKKFSHFLLAMPHVLKLQSGNDGLFVFRIVNHKSEDESAPTVDIEPVTSVVESEINSDLNLNAERNSSEHEAEKSPVSLLESRVLDHATNLQKSEKKEIAKAHATHLHVPKKDDKPMESTPPTYVQGTREQDKKVKLQKLPKNIEVTSLKDCRGRNEDQLHEISEHSSSAESGISRKVWKTWFVHSETIQNVKNCNKVDETPTEKDPVASKSAVTASPALFSPSSHEALINGKALRSSAVATCRSSQEVGLFYQIASWCKFWGSQKSSDITELNCEKVDRTKTNFVQPDFFAKESFWSEIESFVDTSEGSTLISQSRTREHLAQNLQERGPSVLRSLTEGNLIHLVHLLISDKKWIEECDSPIFPFKLTRPVGKDMHGNHPLSSNGLSLMFAVKQPSLRELGDGKHQKPPHTGVAQTSGHQGFSSKPRNEILVDCRKLVDQLVKENPEGFNMGSFRKLFLEKYGYGLDLKKLGYKKIANLFETIPGVRIESYLIIPVKSDNNHGHRITDLPFQESKIDPVADSDGESNDSDSWEELGPINHTSSKKEAMDSLFTRKDPMKQREPSRPHYEPLKDDDFSDSDDETRTKSESEGKHKVSQDESSLLQILESWYSGKEGDSRKDELVNSEKEGYSENDESVNISNASDRSKNILEPGTLASLSRSTDPALAKQSRKPKPSKNYSFVLEQPVDSKDRQVDDLLGSLKKAAREPC